MLYHTIPDQTMSLSKSAASLSGLQNRSYETQLQQLKTAITCKVCKKFYNAPKILVCLHSFCLSCLDSLHTQEEDDCLQCPDCHKLTNIPHEGKIKLPSAFLINRKLEEYAFLQKVSGKVENKCEKCSDKSVKATMYCEGCRKFVCDLCVTIHKSWAEFSSHNLLKLSQLRDNYQAYLPDHPSVLSCSAHSKECNIYCETCKREICHECIIKSHRDHRYNLVVDSAKQHKKDMMEKLKDLDGIPEELNKAISKLETLSSGFSYRGKAISKEVKETFVELEKSIVKQKSSLLDQAANIVESKVKLLQNQKALLDSVKVKVTSCHSFVQQTVDSDHIPDFFMMEERMRDRVSEVSKEFAATELTPVEEPEIYFSISQTQLDAVCTVGNVSDGSILHVGPKTGEPITGQTNFIVKEVVTFYIALSSAYYKMTNNPSEELSAEFQSLRDGSICPATVAISNSGFAKIQCAFADRGRYQLRVLVGGQHIIASPYSFVVKPAADQFNQPLRSITKLTSPRGVAINGKNQIIATQETANTVTIYGRKCKKVLAFGSPGTEPGEFNQPTGVAVDDDGNIYVADTKNNRVQKFDSQGVFIALFAGSEVTESECGPLSGPAGIKVNNKQDVFVVDRGNGRIIVLTLDLKFKRSFGSHGQNFTQFQDPWDIAFDAREFCYITDIKQHCIFIFSDTGDFRGRIGSMGTQKSRLNRPSGIAINKQGQIFVCEFGNHRVSIFHVSSEFIDCFSGGLSMVNPCSIAIDNDGFVYLSTAEAVHVF